MDQNDTPAPRPSAPPTDSRKILGYGCVNPAHRHHHLEDCHLQPIYSDTPMPPRPSARDVAREFFGCRETQTGPSETVRNVWHSEACWTGWAGSGCLRLARLIEQEREGAADLRAKVDMLVQAVQSVQHNRTCSCYRSEPCLRCKIGYDDVDAAVKAMGVEDYAWTTRAEVAESRCAELEREIADVRQTRDNLAEENQALLRGQDDAIQISAQWEQAVLIREQEINRLRQACEKAIACLRPDWSGAEDDAVTLLRAALQGREKPSDP